MTTTPIDRYDVNDALSALAGGRLSDDVLNELTHQVADAIDAANVSRHDDPIIDAFLADGNYANIEEWMSDSDYLLVEDEWVDLDDNPVGAPEGVIEGAIEASGFEA